MNNILISAPGKIIIHGEHSVVYGKSAIACSLNRRTYLSLKQNDNKRISIILPDIEIEKSWRLDEINKIKFLQEFDIKTPQPPSDETLCQLRNFLSLGGEQIQQKDIALVGFLFVYHCLCRHRDCGFEIEVKSELPIGAGLGSSAGFSVCLSSALLLLVELVSYPKESHWKTDDLELINKWAFVLETLNHGKPSGIDNSIATYGKAIKFKAGCIERLEKMPALQILLVNTKVPRSTKDLVSNVRRKYDKYQSIVEPVLNSMEAIVEKSKEMFSQMCGIYSEMKSNYEVLQDAIDMNQDLLRFLGVSHPSLEEVCKICLSHDLHAKLTGAGGGGCAFCLINPDTSKEDLDAVKAKLRDLNYDCWETSVGGNGVTCHMIDDCNTENMTAGKHVLVGMG